VHRRQRQRHRPLDHQVPEPDRSQPGAYEAVAGEEANAGFASEAVRSAAQDRRPVGEGSEGPRAGLGPPQQLQELGGVGGDSSRRDSDAQARLEVAAHGLRTAEASQGLRTAEASAGTGRACARGWR